MYRENSNGTWDVQQPLAALHKEINAKCCGNIATPTLVREKYSPAAASFVVNTREHFRPAQIQAQRKPIWVYCKRAHTSANCHAVTDVAQRKEILKQAKRCFNCLSSNHAIKACTSRFTCRKCNARHHTSTCQPLHKQTLATKIQPEAANRTTHVAIAPANSQVLLKTTSAVLRNGRIKATMNILFDEGSQNTFITAAAAQRLQVDTTDCKTENINLSTFGDIKSTPHTYPVTEIDLVTHKGSSTIKAIVAPNIAAPIYNHVPHVAAFHAYLQHLPLASQTPANTINIDVLIGADFFWSIVGNTVVRGPGPTAVASSLVSCSQVQQTAQLYP